MKSMTDWQAAAEDLFSDDSKGPYGTLVIINFGSMTGHRHTFEDVGTLVQM